MIDLDALSQVIGADTALVSVMAANNEIGVLQPLAEIGALTRQAGAVFHVDAAQAAGKIPIDVKAMQIDLLSLTGHKLYGPKGSGAIFVRKQAKVEPLIVGGGQERGMRSGTLNVPGIVGLGAACALCQAEMPEESARMLRLRDRLLSGLTADLDGVIVNGSLDHRLPNNLHVSFTDVDGESLLIGISDIAVSSGSACSSASGLASHVLRAIMGEDVPSASIRFGLGRGTTDDEIDYTVGKFVSVVRHLRSYGPCALTVLEEPAWLSPRPASAAIPVSSSSSSPWRSWCCSCWRSSVFLKRRSACPPSRRPGSSGWSAQSNYDDLASAVQTTLKGAEPSLVVFDIDGVPDGSKQAEQRRAQAIRLRDGLAIAPLPAGFKIAPASGSAVDAAGDRSRWRRAAR